MNELSTTDLDKTFASTNANPDLMASFSIVVLSALLEVHAPLKRIKISSHHAPKITADLKNLMKERDLAKRKSEIDASCWSGYRRLRNKDTYELRKRVQEYYHDLVDQTQNNSKAMWKTLNKVLLRNSNRMVSHKIIFKRT